MKRLLVSAITTALVLMPFGSALAHPGRTDANGGHYCWTNCAKWGLSYGEYHYHNGGYSSGGSSSSTHYSSSSASYKSVQPEAPTEPTGLKVTIPSFDVYINGTKINNQSSKYPVFVYNDITYFPMTWNYTQALGLDTSWSSDTGFSIRKGGKTTALKQDIGYINPSTRAQMPSFNVWLNDSWVDNSKEDYPVLVYNDVTYFPMTWHNAVDELGLNLEFDQSTGLKLSK